MGISGLRGKTDRGVGEGRIQLRVYIGVTGHRALPDAAAVSDRIGAVLDELERRLCPSGRTSVAFTVLSPLADGADRIVAETILGRLGGRLWVPLPLPVAPPEEPPTTGHYDHDFESSSRLDFHRLLQKARWSRVVSDKSRPQAYTEVGQFVVDHSDVMIAVWDGVKKPNTEGGTADIVDYTRTNDVPYVVVPPDGGTPSWHLGAGLEKASETEHFNGLQCLSIDAHMADERAYRVPENGPWARDERLRELCDWMLPSFVRADQSALWHQRRYQHCGTAVFTLAAAAVTVGSLQALFWKTVHGLAWIEVACFVVGLVVVKFAVGNRLSRRWLWSRALAERLRSAYFLAVAGCNDEPVEGPERQSEDERWVVDAAEAVWAVRPHMGISGDEEAKLRSYLVEHWIEDQRSYHERASNRQKRKHERVKVVVLGAIACALAAATLHATGWLEEHDVVSRALTALAIVPPTWAAAFTGIAEQREWRRNAENFSRMQDRLAGLLTDLERRGTIADGLGEEARYTDSVMRIENQGWFGLMQARDIQPIA